MAFVVVVVLSSLSSRLLVLVVVVVLLWSVPMRRMPDPPKTQPRRDLSVAGQPYTANPPGFGRAVAAGPSEVAVTSDHARVFVYTRQTTHERGNVTRAAPFEAGGGADGFTLRLDTRQLSLGVQHRLLGCMGRGVAQSFAAFLGQGSLSETLARQVARPCARLAQEVQAARALAEQLTHGVGGAKERMPTCRASPHPCCICCCPPARPATMWGCVAR